MSDVAGSGWRERRRRGGGQPDSAPAADAPVTLPDRPLLSVVVPVYQVEEYLADCLDSLLAQSYPDLDVVLVDDGSRDGSTAIAQRYARADPRLTLLRQPNQGLGAARNAGVAAASGQLVTFLDSDDTVPPTAYAALVGSLRRTGSDFAVGALARQGRDGSYRQRPWVRRLHERYRPAVTVSDVPEALANVFAWTKVFRRDFLQRTGLRFPVGTRYEDQVPMTRAYLEAAAFDVLPDLVYLWRTRQDGSSITQRKSELADLRDRVAVVAEVRALVRARRDPALLEAWYGKVFEFDLMAYMRAAVTAGDDYWRLLAASVRPIVDEAPGGAWEGVEARFRLAAWLVAHRDRAALGRLLAFEPLSTGNVPVRHGAAGLEIDLGAMGLDDLPFPDHLLRMRAADLVLRTRLDAVRPREGALDLDGVALVTFVPPSAADPVPGVVEMVRQNRTALLRFPTRSTPRPEADLFAARPFEEHAGSAFGSTVDLHRLVAESTDADPVVWESRLVLTAGGAERSGPFERRLGHGPGTVPVAVLVDGALVTGSWSERLGLSLTVTRRFAALTAAEADADGVLLDLALPAGQVPVRILLRREPVAAAWTAIAGGVRVRLGTANLKGRKGRVAVVVDAARPVPVVVVTSDLDVGGLQVAGSSVEADRALRLTVAETSPQLVVEEVRAGRRSACLTGRAAHLEEAVVLLRGPQATTAPVAVAVADGRFEVELALEVPGWDGRQRPLPAGSYTLVGRCGDDRVRLRASRRLQRRTDPAEPAGWSVEVSDSLVPGLRRAALGAEQRSELGQRRLRARRYGPARAGPRSRTALFETSSQGLTWTDCGPLAARLAAHEPGLEPLWACADDAAVPPPGTRPVLRESPEWHTALGTARIVVTDGTLPPFLDPPAGQLVVRLGTGTPVRAPDATCDARRWDLIVSAGPACTRAIRRALRNGAPAGAVMETGQPRHDALVAPDRAATRAAARAALGVGADQRLLLYAPTTRETLRAHSRREKVSHLDVQRLLELPDLVVAHRAHPTSVHQPELRAGPRFHDVTRVPDLGALVLAADLLVTDCSSVLADCVLTDTPVFLLAPDLPAYQAAGLLVDLDDPPGPVVTSTEELVTAFGRSPARWQAARARFREELAPLADGHATERVVDALVDRLR